MDFPSAWNQFPLLSHFKGLAPLFNLFMNHLSSLQLPSLLLLLTPRLLLLFFHQVKDDDRALGLGSLTIPLIRLLATSDLTMDQWFQLENSGSASRIYIKLVLRVSVSHYFSPWFLTCVV